MILNTEMIKALSPCKNRLENYLQHYEKFSGSMKEFLDLEHLTNLDKRWVACRVITKEQRVRWAALCAQSVLHLFETKYPDDKRPRAAIELMLSGNYSAYAAANSAYAAANAAANAAADAADAADAANAAANAAYAANAAANAAYAAADAAYAAANAAYAANAAADAANAAAANARKDQNKKNWQFLIDILGENSGEIEG